ncbi:MAG: tetratricopeptide repeat protein, partial [Nannocystaceae bacterium]
MGTLFLPAESSSELPRPTLDAPRRRQPPPPPPTGRDRSGPPSIGLDDAGRHNELDLGGAAGGDLELDFGGAPGAPPVASPPPAIEMPSESGLDFPMLDEPSLFDPDEDLPGPVASPRRDPAADLPMPVVEARDPTADLPTPVAAPGLGPGMGGSGLDDLTGDLAGGFDFDLPAPVDQARAASMGPSFDADLPTPVELDLPLAGGASPDIGLDLPMPADQLGGAGQQLQPAYGNQGLRPAAGGQQLQPAYGDQDLRPAAGTQQLQPAYGDQDMRPAEIGVAPATLDMAPANLDMAPANLEMQPKLEGTELAPGDLPGPVPAGGPSARAAGGYPNAAPATSMGQTAPMPASSDGAAGSIAARTSQAGKPPAVSRGVLIAAGGLLLLGLAGAAVLYSGILDPDDPETTATRGAKKKTAAAKNDDDGGQTQGDDGGTQTPATVIAERSPAVLAILAKHTPQAYLEARAKATEAGDVIGAAEAALLLHFYYGPNPAMLAEAGKDLQPHVGNEAPFVQRVVGLASLAADNLDGADKALTGDDERTRLYRGWVHLQRGELDEAMAEAKAVITASPDEVAARHLELATRAKREPVAAIPAIQAALESNPSHAGLQALVATTGIATGRLAAARRAVDAIDPAGTDDPGVQAWSHVQRARVRLAQGDREGALADYDAAIERVPEVVPVQMERVRALVLAGLLNDASSSVSSLVREHPQDAQLQLLQAQVATRSGDVDIALGVLETLAVSLPEDPRVMITKGDAHTMRLEIDEGQTAYAAARALDPTAIEAAMGEAVLLSDAKQLPKALTVLEEARGRAGAGGGPGVVGGRLVAQGR